MKPITKSLTAVVLGISLMLSVWCTCVVQARLLHPPSSSSSSSSSSKHSSLSYQALLPGSRTLLPPSSMTSLRRIPPSIPNPTQNKSNLQIKG